MKDLSELKFEDMDTARLSDLFNYEYKYLKRLGTTGGLAGLKNEYKRFFDLFEYCEKWSSSFKTLVDRFVSFYGMEKIAEEKSFKIAFSEALSKGFGPFTMRDEK